MAGFLQKHAAGDIMAEQSWGQLGDVTSVLQRLDMQLQRKFERIDMEAEERQVQAGRVTELIQEVDRMAHAFHVGVDVQKTQNVELAVQADRGGGSGHSLCTPGSWRCRSGGESMYIPAYMIFYSVLVLFYLQLALTKIKYV